MRSTDSPEGYFGNYVRPESQHGKNRANGKEHAATDAVYAAAEFLKNPDSVPRFMPECLEIGGGHSLNQTCSLVPKSGPGNFGALQEISPVVSRAFCDFPRDSHFRASESEESIRRTFDLFESVIPTGS